MSGIAGICRFDGELVQHSELWAMLNTLQCRGPDRSETWCEGSIGIGHAMLLTIPESVREFPPVVNRRGDLVITADVRLDNRSELVNMLGLRHQSPHEIGDHELLLGAYEKWGQKSAARLLGAFAFAIWDERRRTLYCARDHFGIKPFVYHHSPGSHFAFGSQPITVLAAPKTPYRIDEGRIADFLITQLEGIDKISTFFEEVYRLPPAHTLTVTSDGLRQRRYWMLEPEPELRLPSDDAYVDAFLDVFGEAVRCRLRGVGQVGAMLSGGMDSSSVAAVARDLMAETGTGPLHTFSAKSPQEGGCAETVAIEATLSTDGFEPCAVDYERMDEFLPALANHTWNADDPFDNHMTLVRLIYLAAHRNGITAVLDGIDGDTVLSAGNHLAHLLRRGRWRKAYLEALGQERFWDGAIPAWRGLYHSARLAFAPASVRHLRRNLFPRREQRKFIDNVRASIISPEFARSVGLMARLRALDAHRPEELLSSPRQEHVLALDHPYLTAGLERYDRVASAVGIEPRHPFLDRRVVAFCLSLPNEQKLDGGWPKVILRRSMNDRLPHSVRWRRGKQHLGWEFTKALMKTEHLRMQAAIEGNMGSLSRYVDVDKVREASSSYFGDGDMSKAEPVYEAACLALWLDSHENRRLA